MNLWKRIKTHKLDDRFRKDKLRLVSELREQGIKDERVLQAIAFLPRHLFLDEGLAKNSYANCSLPIGYNQTISQPYIVARMTEFLLTDDIPDKVLEIGTGSGYQTAVLAILMARIFTVERIKALHDIARRRLRILNMHNVHFRYGDGSKGWRQFAPFDAIMVTAAAAQVPSDLVGQLSIGGKMVIPVGAGNVQHLILIRRCKYGFQKSRLEAVKFVPLV